MDDDLSQGENEKGPQLTGVTSPGILVLGPDLVITNADNVAVGFLSDLGIDYMGRPAASIFRPADRSRVTNFLRSRSIRSVFADIMGPRGVFPASIRLFNKDENEVLLIIEKMSGAGQWGISIEDLPAPAILISGSGKLVSTNRAYERQSGVDSQSVLAENIVETGILTEDVWKSVSAACDNLMVTSLSSEELVAWLNRRDGTRYRATIKISLLSNRFAPKPQKPSPDERFFIVEIYDVTRSFNRLKEMEEQQKFDELLLSHLNLPIVASDQYGVITDFNDAAARLFGHDKEAMIGLSIKGLMPHSIAEDHDGFVKGYWNKPAADRSAFEITTKARHCEGFKIDITINVIPYEVDKEFRLLAVFHPQSAAERELLSYRKSYEEAAKALEGSSYAFMHIGDNGAINAINHAALKILGFGSMDEIGSITEALSWSNYRRLVEGKGVSLRDFAGMFPEDICIPNKNDADGSVIFLKALSIYMPFLGKMGMIVVLFDVTEMENERQRIRNNETIVRELVNGMPVALMQIGVEDGVISSANDACLALTGHERHEIAGVEATQLLPAEILSEIKLSLSSPAQDGFDPSQGKLRYQTFIKDVNGYSWNIDLLVGKSSIVSWSGEVKDAYSFIFVEREFVKLNHESFARLGPVDAQNFVEKSTELLDGVFVFADQAFNIILCYGNCHGVTLYENEELPGKTIGELFPDPHKSKYIDGLRAYRPDTDVEENSRSKIEASILRKDGTTASVVIYFKIIVHGYDRYWMAYARNNETHDFERLLENERDLVQQRLDEYENNIDDFLAAQKFSGLATIAAGVAHEVNSPLDAARSALFALHRKFKSPVLLEHDASELEEMFAIIDGNLDRAAHMVKNFKSLSSDQAILDPREYGLHDVIGQSLSALKYEMSKFGEVAVNINCATDLVVYGDPGNLAQILTGLVKNSLDHGFSSGDPKTGVIDITVTGRGHNFEMIYEDNGVGMNAITRSRIFDPFFTTGLTRENSGLGMSVIYRLITQTMSGSIEVDEAVHGGALFTITLPMVQGK